MELQARKSMLMLMLLWASMELQARVGKAIEDRATEAIMEAIKEMGETCLPGATQKTQWELG